MTEQNTATKGTRRSAKSTNGEASGKFTDEERAAANEARIVALVTKAAG